MALLLAIIVANIAGAVPPDQQGQPVQPVEVKNLPLPVSQHGSWQVQNVPGTPFQRTVSATFFDATDYVVDELVALPSGSTRLVIEHFSAHGELREGAAFEYVTLEVTSGGVSSRHYLPMELQATLGSETHHYSGGGSMRLYADPPTIRFAARRLLPDGGAIFDEQGFITWSISGYLIDG